MMTRRDFLTGTAGLAAQVPFRLPLGALDFLDPTMHLHNVEIHAQIKAAGSVGNDGITCPLWVKGAHRVFPASGVDITDPRKPFVAFKPAPGGNLAYATRLKKWITINSGFVSLTSPTPEFPRGQYHKEYVEKTYGAYKSLRGIRTYDVTDPSSPALLQEFSVGTTGGGTHANFYDGGKYAYLDCGWDETLRMESSERPFSNGLMIVDVSDPGNVKEVARWWVPGQKFGEEKEYKKFSFADDQSSWTGNHGGAVVPRRVEDGGTIGYCGMGHFGMYVLDLSDIRHPQPIGRLAYDLEAMGGIPHHSIYPIESAAASPSLQHKVISVFESLESDCREPWHTPYVIDVRDPRHPKVVGIFPRPAAPPDAPYADFCQARGRFSSHNIQAWAAPGVAKPTFVAMTYFNAGLQIFDITNPREPKRVAYFVPPRRGDLKDPAKFESWRRADVNVFVEWDRNLIWVSTGYLGDQNGEVFCLSTPTLGTPVLEPRKVTRWTRPHINAGWDDETRVSVRFGRPSTQLA
jgi:hypothetical protein